MGIPNTYTDINETDCCAIPNVDDWDGQDIRFENKHFVRLHTRSLFFIPLNMGRIMTKLNSIAMANNATMPAQEAIILSRDISPWKAEQLYGVSRAIDDVDNVTLTGDFLTRVFEGSYNNIKNWHTEMQQYAESRGESLKGIYFFYTTCPKCAKHYGKNYTIGLAEVE